MKNVGSSALDAATGAVAPICALSIPLFLYRGLLPYLITESVLWMIAAVAFIGAAVLRFRFLPSASIWFVVGGAATTGLSAGSILVLAAWTLDVDPTGHATTKEPLLGWLSSLRPLDLAGVALLFSLPRAVLAVLAYSAFRVGCAWRGAAERAASAG